MTNIIKSSLTEGRLIIFNSKKTIRLCRKGRYFIQWNVDVISDLVNMFCNAPNAVMLVALRRSFTTVARC
jgi:hypothetical protein